MCSRLYTDVIQNYMYLTNLKHCFLVMNLNKADTNTQYDLLPGIFHFAEYHQEQTTELNFINSFEFTGTETVTMC